ncbi:MAG: acyl-CoA dehydratase activase-related protein, partial [Aristaeellaceae bacterium]
SESECYPAKLAHGHVQWLIQQGVTTVFLPCVFYEHQEDSQAQNHYNCPMVSATPENLNNNVEDVTGGRARIVKPFLALTSEKVAADRLVRVFREEWNVPEQETRAAVHAAWAEQLQAKADIRRYGQEALDWMQAHHRRGIVLAGRPYHIDPEINHGIPELVASYGLAVLTEDSIPEDFPAEHPLRVTDQWVYHSRLYRAAEFVRTREDIELIQLNSFGCGLDAVTTDQVCEILEGSGKLYTVLKIDEVNSLGAARIRVRSLLAAMDMRQKQGIVPKVQPASYHRAEFTQAMREEGYTILAPRMSPIHFDLLEPIFRQYGYNVVMLDNDTRAAIDMGLKYVNNDACYPSIIVVGQMMEAVLSGRYDTDHLALAITQTGGCCRASNYVGFIRRALEKAGLSHIPVISINANGMEKNEGFRVTPGLLMAAGKAVVIGDLLMRCLYRVRPYEKEPGSADRLAAQWQKRTVDALLGQGDRLSYKAVCQGLVRDFDALPIHEDMRKPRVGIVGEILVKYMPLANNNLVELLEQEGAEAVVPDLMDFMNYSIYNGDFKYENLGARWTSALSANAGVDLIHLLRKPALDALKRSRRFEAPMPIRHIAHLAEPFLSLGNQYGEGWFLTGEMAELLESGVPNIVCIQPFACLPNHVVGKGVIKKLRSAYPQANIVAVDFDPGASEVNQLNRIKLMLSTA